MLNHYLKMAFRQQYRQPMYSLITILGLAIGLATCLLILVYVMDELRYDRFHIQAEHTYLVRHRYLMGDNEYDWHETAFPLAQRMITDFPEVASVTTVTAPVPYPYRYQDKVIGGIETICADTAFLQIFDFPLLAGNKSSALSGPYSIVISEQMVHQFFGGDAGDMAVYEQALGQIISLDNEPYTITGIVQSPPAHSHLQFGAILSLATILQDEYRRETWMPAGLLNYVVLKKNGPPHALKEKLVAVERAYLWPQMEKHVGASLEKLAANTDKYGYYLEPITDIHLIREGYITYVYLFSAVGVLILILACVNFINLATARAMQRAREVGVRKTLGSSSMNLVKQFMIETALYSILAACVAVIIIMLVREPFAYLSGKVLHWGMLIQPGFLACFAGLILLVTLFAGMYPALYLPAFHPVAVLKGRGFHVVGTKTKSVRDGLIILQFAISTGLMICSVVIYQQLRFLQEKEPGFTKENVLVVSNAYSLGADKEAFKHAVSALPQVSHVSFSYAVPSSTFDAFGLYKRKGSDKEHQFYWMSADHDYLETYTMEVVAGRNFSRQFPADSTAILLNQTAARQLGGEEIIGATLTDHFNRAFTVIGIVQDFNFAHLKNRIDPLVITLATPGNVAYTSVRIKPGNIAATVQAIESRWQSFDPDAPFEYSFMDEKFNALFHAEQRMSDVMRIFTGLSLIIACLGLFGLSVFSAQQRTKEIGIRKVLGATLSNITILLSKDFVRLVVVAIVVSSPIAWWAMNRWLEGFAYRIDISWWVFAMVGLTALLIAVLTISFQSIKAALANPVDSLRNE